MGARATEGGNELPVVSVPSLPAHFDWKRSAEPVTFDATSADGTRSIRLKAVYYVKETPVGRDQPPARVSNAFSAEAYERQLKAAGWRPSKSTSLEPFRLSAPKPDPPGGPIAYCIRYYWGREGDSLRTVVVSDCVDDPCAVPDLDEAETARCLAAHPTASDQQEIFISEPVPVDALVKCIKRAPLSAESECP
jgi:hypothetical protein